MRQLVALQRLLLLLVTTVFPTTSGYRSGVPPVNRRALAGLWKLTPSVLSIKEFTVHPRREPKKPEEELLLMLKEDGSFTRYESLPTTEDEEEKEQSVNVDQSWKQYVKQQSGEPIKTLFKGTWDYRDGELILAADRDEPKAKSDNYGAENSNDDDNSQQHRPNAKQQHLFWKKGKDTILVGAVVATPNRGQSRPTNLTKNNTSATTAPKSKSTTTKSTASSASPTTTTTTTSISVPMGSVQVGKFFYPKHHPSFFDQPMFQPRRFNTFQMKQVLGNAIKEEKEDMFIEKFRNKDFHNKRFFLTSSPIEPRRPKGNVRWSIKYNKYVEDPPSKEAKAAADAEKNRPSMAIRVMKVMIHANNTFSTLAGLGDTTNILRGRFNVIGEQRDQVFMQSVRFGFGRSVSGSTYSEGNALSEETKSYWGKISYEEDEQEDTKGADSKIGKEDPSVVADSSSQEEKTTEENDDDDKDKKTLQVKGSVIVGWGLEPQPIARFIMREAKDDAEFFDEYDEDEDEEDDDEDEENEDEEEDNYGDWASGDAFQ